MRNVLIAAMITLQCACASIPDGTQSWCHDGLVPNADLGQEIDTVRVVPIRVDRLMTAMELLSTRQFVLISQDSLAQLADVDVDKSAGDFYLIRSGIFAQDGASFGEIKQASDTVGVRSFQYREADRRLSIFNLQGLQATRLHQVPLLVQMRLNPRSVQAYCDTHW